MHGAGTSARPCPPVVIQEHLRALATSRSEKSSKQLRSTTAIVLILAGTRELEKLTGDGEVNREVFGARGERIGWGVRSLSAARHAHLPEISFRGKRKLDKWNVALYKIRIINTS